MMLICPFEKIIINRNIKYYDENIYDELIFNEYQNTQIEVWKNLNKSK